MNWDLICQLLQPFGIVKKRNRSFSTAASILLLDAAAEDAEHNVYIAFEESLPHPFLHALVIYLQHADSGKGQRIPADNYICLSKGSPAQIANTLLRAQSHLETLSDRLAAATRDQEVLDIAGECLKSPLFYFDASYRVLAITRNVSFPHDPEWDHMLTKGFLSLDSVKRMQENGDLDLLADKRDPFPYKSDIYPFESLVCNIWIGDVLYGRLNMLCLDHSPTEQNIQECRIICRHLLRIAHTSGEIRKEAGPLNQMVLDLLKGLQLSEELIRDRIRQIPALRNSLVRVCCIETNAGNDPQVLKYYISLINRMFSAEQALALEFEEKVVLLLHAPEETSFQALILTLDHLLQSQELKGGISNVFYRFNSLRDFYLQAQAALSLGQKSTGVNDFKEVYFDYLLSYLPAHLAAAMAAPGVIRLLRLQKDYQFPLAETLKTYLECSCNLQATAEKLYIHKNTALYRLNHIRSIIDADLEDADQRLYLMVSFKIIERYPPIL